MSRIISGIQPSGKLHIGNYFGMMKPAIEMQKKNEAFLFIADYHALTSLKDPILMKEYRQIIAATWLSFFKDQNFDTLPSYLYKLISVYKFNEASFVAGVILILSMIIFLLIDNINYQGKSAIKT